MMDLTPEEWDAINNLVQDQAKATRNQYEGYRDMQHRYTYIPQWLVRIIDETHKSSEFWAALAEKLRRA